MPEEWRPNIQTCWIAMTTIGFGCLMYALFDRSFPTPIGLLWGISTEIQDSKTRFDIFHLYVIPCARRHGVASRLLQEVANNHDFVHTGMAEDEGGLKFLKATGFVFFQNCGIWLRKCPVHVPKLNSIDKEIKGE